MTQNTIHSWAVGWSKNRSLINRPVQEGLRFGAITGVAIASFYLYSCCYASILSTSASFSISTLITVAGGLTIAGPLLGAALAATIVYQILPRTLTLDEFDSMLSDFLIFREDLWLSFYDKNPEHSNAICEKAFTQGVIQLFEVLRERHADFAALPPRISLWLGAYFKDTKLIMTVLNSATSDKARADLVNNRQYSEPSIVVGKGRHLPALCAMFGHDVDFIKELFSSYGAVNDAGGFNDTVLRLAAERGNAPLIKMLINDLGLDPNDQTQANTHQEEVEVENVDEGVSDYTALPGDARTDGSGTKGAPLHRALISVLELLKKDPNAEIGNYREAIKTLVDLGAEVNSFKAQVLIKKYGQGDNQFAGGYVQATPLELAEHIDGERRLSGDKRLAPLLQS